MQPIRSKLDGTLRAWMKTAEALPEKRSVVVILTGSFNANAVAQKISGTGAEVDLPSESGVIVVSSIGKDSLKKIEGFPEILSIKVPAQLKLA